MEAVLGFLLRQDKDLLDVYHLDLVEVSNSRRLRRRTPLGDMLGDCWIWWYSARRNMYFSDHLVSERA
jgi:hypothetical protein